MRFTRAMCCDLFTVIRKYVMALTRKPGHRLPPGAACVFFARIGGIPHIVEEENGHKLWVWTLVVHPSELKGNEVLVTGSSQQNPLRHVLRQCLHPPPAHCMVGPGGEVRKNATPGGDPPESCLVMLMRHRPR